MRGRRNSRRCRNCPDTPPAVYQPVQDAEAKFAAKSAGQALSTELLTSLGESQRLWNHVLFGTSTCISMIAGYTRMGLPGDPLDQLKLLRERLDEVIRKHEVKHEHQSSSERVPSDSTAD